MIERNLKHIRFIFDPERKEFSIYRINSENMIGNNIHLSITEAFAFLRVIVRAGQKYIYRGIKYENNKKRISN